MKIKFKGEKLKNCTPPGIDFISQLKVVLIGLSIAIGWSVSYFAKYLSARSDLYEYSLKGMVLKEGAVMREFNLLLHDVVDSLTGFSIFYMVMIGLVLYYYLSYYQESKSIYLMRRLPDKWELHKRCVVLPFAALLTGVITELAIVMLYYGIYLMFTPKECLPFNVI